jgi:hypothetical protein
MEGKADKPEGGESVRWLAIRPQPFTVGPQGSTMSATGASWWCTVTTIALDGSIGVGQQERVSCCWLAGGGIDPQQPCWERAVLAAKQAAAGASSARNSATATIARLESLADIPSVYSCFGTRP